MVQDEAIGSWAIGFETDGDPATLEFNVALTGITRAITVLRNDGGEAGADAQLSVDTSVNTSSGVNFQTPEADEWSFRLCASKRLVECIARDWTPLVKAVRVPGKGCFMFPMLVGAIDTDWIIAR